MLDAETAALSDYLGEAVPALLARSRVPGATVAVARGGSVCFELAFGHADVERDEPMTPASVGRSGSMGKTYTATAVMQLVERGALALDADVNDHLDFAVTNPLGGGPVTVLDLLTHCSGLAGNGASCTFGRPPALRDHLARDFAEQRRDFFASSLPKWTEPVGRRMQYSNTGIALLGLLVQNANPQGLTFSAYLQRHVIEPLGMASTVYPPVNDDPAAVDSAILARATTGYTIFGDVRYPATNIRFADYPAGLVLTTAGDHVRLVAAYLQGGAFGDCRILAADTVAAMLTPRVRPGGEPVAPDDPGPATGLVWSLADGGTPLRRFGHAGAHMWGWSNDCRGYPELDLGIAVLTNGWDLGRYLSGDEGPGLASAATALAAQFVADRRAGRTRSAAAWPWKTAYAAGVAAAVANHGLLGIGEPLPDEGLADLARGMQATATWDPDGYTTGYRDAAATVPLTLDGVEAFLGSDACRLSRAELDAVWPQLGSGPYPLPLGAGIRAEVS